MDPHIINSAYVYSINRLPINLYHIINYLVSLCLASSRLASPRFVSPRLVSALASPRLVSSHLASPRLVSSPLVSHHLASSCLAPCSIAPEKPMASRTSISIHVVFICQLRECYFLLHMPAIVFTRFASTLSARKPCQSANGRTKTHLLSLDSIYPSEAAIAAVICYPVAISHNIVFFFKRSTPIDCLST